MCRGAKEGSAWLGAEFTTGRKTGTKKIWLCKAGSSSTAAAPTPLEAEGGGAAASCASAAPARLPHASSVAEVSVTAGVGQMQKSAL